MEQFESKVKQLDALKKVTLYCSQHQGKELEIYCETCEELICHNCTVSKHCRPEHKYVLVSDTFVKHKAEITASLDKLEEKLGLTNEALEQLDVRSQDLDDQQAAIEENIQRERKLLIEAIEARTTELIGKADSYTKMKKKNLAAQRNELETVQTQLASCLSFVRDSLKRGSEGEVMKIKNGVMKQIKEMTDNFKPDMLPPCENANVKFTSSLPIQVRQLQQFGKVHLKASPEKSYATGKGLEIAKVGERATAIVNIVDDKEKACPVAVKSLTCELVSETTGEKKDCSVKKTGDSRYEISYQAASQGRHQLHIKVEGDHIKGSPFPVTVKLPVKKLSTPIKTISGVILPWGVAVNQKGELIVSECSGHCVSIFSPAGKKLRSFGSKGSGHGQFNSPCGVAVDDGGNILVVDGDNHRIQKFTSDGKFITALGKEGNKPLEFTSPVGIAIHPLNKKVYVADRSNHRIQILNPNLTFSSSYGSCGSDNGQFQNPWDVAFDSTGNVYVVDVGNHRIQVFTAEGEYLRKFGKHGSGNGEMNWPSSIAIDSDNAVHVTEYSNNRVSVFTCYGNFLTSFGSRGSGSGQFNEPCGVAVDKNVVVYVSDSGNNRLQYF